MRVCAVTPHLPPAQAANALLPRQLAEALAAHDVTTTFVSHPPSGDGAPTPVPGVTLVPRRGHGVFARTPAGALVSALAIARRARQPIRASDIVHLHGNGLIVEVSRQLADRYGVPYIVTLYGTDVWHHDPEKHARFARVVTGARARIFYSQGLLEFGRPLGLAPAPSRVIYAPVPASFQAPDAEARARLRRDAGVGDGPLLVTVKRLHEVAGYDVLLRSLVRVFEAWPSAQAWIVGEGALRQPLEAEARALGLGARVRFLGRIDNDQLWRYYGAADLFVLPSRLESWGTVMLEALACGTCVVATDTVGGVEVHGHFPADVVLAPRENPAGLAEAITGALARRARVSQATADRLRAEFSVDGCAVRYLDVYREALGAA